MVIGLLLGAIAAAGVTTWAFLRPRGARRSVPFPSLQHVPRGTLLRRRRLALEDVLGWALRIAALALFMGGIVADHLQAGHSRSKPVVLIDPRTGSRGLALAHGIDAIARLGFEGQEPSVEGSLGAWLEPTVRDCSASQQRCLSRAASESRRPVVLVGDRRTGWDGIDELEQPVSWVDAALEPTHVGEPPQPPGRRHIQVERIGASREAALWGAALEVAAEDSSTAPERVVVLDARSSLPAADAGRVIVRVAPGPAASGWPEVKAEPAQGVLLDERSALATEVAALALNSSLAFAADGSTRSIVGRVVIARSDGTRPEISVVATAEELGRWAHEGQLVVLARAVLASLASAAIETSAVPPPGRWGFRDAAGAASAMGALDVAPGVYTREDGQLRVTVADRRVADTPAATTQEERPAAPAEPGTRLLSLAASLLAAAGLALLAALLRARSFASAAIGLCALVSLGLMALDHERSIARAPERVVRLDPAASFAAPALRGAGIRVASATESLGCERPRESSPCVVVAAIGAAAAPPRRADGLIFDPSMPRVELVSIRAPTRVPLGSAARIEVSARVRRGAGKTLTVTARSTRSALAQASVALVGEDQVATTALSVVPLVAGEETLAIEARVGDAEDALPLTLTAETRAPERVVLAGAPSWEARFVYEALRQRAGGHTARLTRIGSTAVQAFGLPREDPLRWLTAEGSLAKVSTLVVTGFRAKELGGGAGRAIAAFAEGGGAVLFLGTEGLEALGWPALPVAEGAVKATTGDLLDGSPPLSVNAALAGVASTPGPTGPTGPLGVEVLATLGPEHRPWMLGRAHGAGRVAVVTTTDLFRLSPPAGQGEEAGRALFRALAWVEAGDDAKGRVEPSSWIGLTTVRRAQVRADAARRGRPFLEPDGAADLARALARLPPPPPRPLPIPLRHDPLALWLTLAALALEALTRKRTRSSGAARAVGRLA